MKKQKIFFSNNFKRWLLFIVLETLSLFFIYTSFQQIPLIDSWKYPYQWLSLSLGISLILGSLVGRFLYIHLTSKKIWLLSLISFSGFFLTLLLSSGVLVFSGYYIGALTYQAAEEPAQLPSITEFEVLEFINNARSDQKIRELKRNAALDKAAKLRAEAIINNQEWKSGIESTVTREQAVGTTYKYRTLGHLVGFVYVNQEQDEIFNFWKTDRNSKETIFDASFVDAGIAITEAEIDGFDAIIISVILASKPVAAPKVAPPPPSGEKQSYPQVAWGGPELWEAVNKRRLELGVNALKQKDELCTIAAIRLNQLLELGKLDGHAGFVPTLEREDLKWINQKYTLNEFLIVGYPTPEEAVKGWEHTLGHRSLLAGGEHAFGCIYSQNTFGVAITGY